MKDQLIRATGLNGKVRAFAARTTGIVEELKRRHTTSPVATAALGRTITAGAMMGAMLKGEEKLTIQVKGGGPIGAVVVDANAKGEVRGYVDEPGVMLPPNAVGKLDVAGAVGTDGFLYVVKDLGLKEPYSGSIPIHSGELAEDFTYYFAKSEQTPSAVSLGVLFEKGEYTVKAAGGFIIQLLPGLTDEEIDEIEGRLGSLPPITTMLDDGLELDEILANVLGMVQIHETMDLQFKCKCSRERVEQTLISLGREELNSLIDEEGKAEVHCHFCNETYLFEGPELRKLSEQLGASK
ncbi:Hsp33 family molecular chaperone HslO [Gorillibacterium sp. sgz5001074]|uniref:Hsp33 family molecular chaperone HslO n=1 Tax=Gorillibacterium sp. sgz5001074 TaxID=3446695 RepID=UPI003F66A019